jgi:hypothetical protein
MKVLKELFRRNDFAKFVVSVGLFLLMVYIIISIPGLVAA